MRPPTVKTKTALFAVLNAIPERPTELPWIFTFNGCVSWKDARGYSHPCAYVAFSFEEAAKVIRDWYDQTSDASSKKQSAPTKVV
jgi:hypothetical protein